MLRSKQRSGHNHDVTRANNPVLLSVRQLDGSQPVFTTPASGNPDCPLSLGEGEFESMPFGGVKYDTSKEEFEDPDTPLALGDKVKVTSLLVFLYGMFFLGVILCAVYN